MGHWFKCYTDLHNYAWGRCYCYHLSISQMEKLRPTAHPQFIGSRVAWIQRLHFHSPAMLFLAPDFGFPVPGVCTCRCLTRDIYVSKNKVMLESPQLVGPSSSHLAVSPELSQLYSWFLTNKWSWVLSVPPGWSFCTPFGLRPQCFISSGCHQPDVFKSLSWKNDYE